MQVSHSGYYEWRDHQPSQRACENTRLLEHIRTAHQRSRQRYGSPRVYHELRSAGLQCSRKRVARLMKNNGIAAKHKKRFRVTTKTKPGMEWFRDILDRVFSPERKDLQWAADITYLWTREGWMYLAIVMDLYSRRIVGWALEPYLTDDLVIQAMQAALQTRRPASGLVHHSDRGSQYGSKEYLKLLGEHGVVSSMSEKGDCWDNAPVESFFSTLKKELGETFETRAQARLQIFEFIEVWYNRQRRHSTLGYASPVEYETIAAQASKA
jgi:transposase InsO family protein